ncbi:MAG: hypothetical protein BWY87_00927 [Deltaproteobacteria bacterium ADurb.Bin510]|nr:MAG: hypothetical protein BWY87_00927 [Deltaproteobacteria bacterium ADurb.Bin510]
MLFVHLEFAHLDGLAEADDAQCVFGAGPAALFLVAAADEGAKRRALAYVEAADALGAVDLVSRDGQEVDIQVAHVDRNLAETLDRVGVEQRALGMRQLGHGLDVLDGADLVVGHHDRDQGGLVGERQFEVVQADAALLVDRQEDHVHTALLEALGGLQDAGMLDGGGDQLVAALDLAAALFG